MDQNQSSFICQNLPYDADNRYTCLPGTYCGSVEGFDFDNSQKLNVDTS